MTYIANKPRPAKRSVQRLIRHMAVLNSFKGVVGLGSEDIEEVCQTYKQDHVKHFISYEIDKKILKKQRTKHKELNDILPVTLCDGNILDHKPYSGYFYELDLCCSAKSLDHRIKKFGKLKTFSITLSCPNRIAGSKLILPPGKTIHKLFHLLEGEDNLMNVRFRKSDIHGVRGECRFSSLVSRTHYIAYWYREENIGQGGRPMDMLTILKCNFKTMYHHDKQKVA